MLFATACICIDRPGLWPPPPFDDADASFLVLNLRKMHILHGYGPVLGGMLFGWVVAGPAFGFAAALSAIAVVLPAGLTSWRGNLLRGAIRRTTFGLLRPVFVTQFIFNTGRLRCRLCAAWDFAAGLSAANFGRLEEASLPPPRRAASISGGTLPEIQVKPPSAIESSQAADPRTTTLSR
jgi:hypothetical protein